MKKSKETIGEQLTLIPEEPGVPTPASHTVKRPPRHNRVTFKEYNQGQMTVMPMSLEELIPPQHVVRVVSAAVDALNLQPLVGRYKGGGASNFNPGMMLKVIIYAYSQRLFSSRQIAKALRENIHFMWISGMNKPNFRTVNRFRSKTLKDAIEPVFTSILQLLIEGGYVKLENYFLDGTKIEANANRYSFVWGKSVRRNEVKLQEKVSGLLRDVHELNKKEDALYGKDDLLGISKEPLNAEQLARAIAELDEKLADLDQDKKTKKAVKTLKEDCLPRLKKYEKQKELLGDRNSLSKTDTDATFMRMKEDHMRNGQLKPGYNIQVGTEGQFIVHCSTHQNRSDSPCLIPHLKELKEQLGRLPNNVVADAGYGSEENYEYLEEQGVTAYVKHGLFHKQYKKSFRNKLFRTENLRYDPETDQYECPFNRKLSYVRTRTYKTDNGYKVERRVYECESCEDCPHKPSCTKSQANRSLEIGLRLNNLRARADQLLTSEHGKELRSLRAVEVESVFGRIKNNWSFRRFFLRGLKKVDLEWKLLSIAHNMTKMALVQ